MKTLPTFLIIGPPRTGTTWMYNCLYHHPDLFFPPLKQLHFFDKHFKKGVQWYRSRFNISSEKAVGEATPDYFCRELYARRIFDTLPGVKLVIIYRDPVERAFSHYKIRARRGIYKGKSFLDVLDDDDFLGNNSLYGRNLSYFLKFFQADAFLIIDYIAMSNFPQAALDRLCKFLDIPPVKVTDSILHQRFSKSLGFANRAWLEKLMTRTQRSLSRFKPGRTVIEALKSRGIIKKIKAANTTSIPVLSEKEYAAAKKSFEEDSQLFRNQIEERHIDYWCPGTG
jgi:hypothetical protein